MRAPLAPWCLRKWLLAGWRQANYAKPAAVVDCLAAGRNCSLADVGHLALDAAYGPDARARARRSRDLPDAPRGGGARGATPVMTLHVQQALQLTHSEADARAVAFWRRVLAMTLGGAWDQAAFMCRPPPGAPAAFRGRGRS